MKKIGLTIAAVVFALSLTGCVGTVSEDSPAPATSTTKQLSNSGTTECVIGCVTVIAYVPPAK